jgi:hypothetical protein
VLEAADSPGGCIHTVELPAGRGRLELGAHEHAGILGSGVLSKLAANDWHLDKTATALGTDRPGLISRLDRAGFANLLRQDVLDAWRARQRRSHT